ncbi:hypothetical protein N9M65_01875 [Luminiphilus sp.]|nr:hypothetical protein [Luminiphilus sp.]
MATVLTDLLHLIIALSPGLIGVLLGAALALIFKRDEPYLLCVLAGGGGIFGYIMIAVLIRVLDLLAIQVFNVRLIAGLMMVLLMAIWFLIVVLFKAKSSARGSSELFTSQRLRLSPARFIIVSMTVVVVFVGLYQVVLTPVMGWDSLGLWTTWAERFIAFDTKPSGFYGKTRAEFGQFPRSHPRHPPTVYHLSAFIGYALHKTEVIRGWLVHWTFIYFCMGAVIVGFVLQTSNNFSLGIFSFYAFFTLPLLENHSIQVGYADFWMAAIVTTSSAFVALAIYHRLRWLMILSLGFFGPAFGNKKHWPFLCLRSTYSSFGCDAWLQET